MRSGKPKPNRGPRQANLAWLRRLVAIIMLGAMAGALAFVYFLGKAPPAPVAATRPSAEPDQAPDLPRVTPASPSPIPTPTNPPTTKRHRVLYIVIDDCGNSLGEFKPFLRFPGHLTFAVMPGLAYTGDCARLAVEHGQGLILHQPMEAIGGQNPGPGAVRSDMDPAEVEAILNRNLDELPGVQGINNHMGSRGTQDTRLLDTIMQVLRERRLFFLDSRTTAKTQGFATARGKGVPAMERDIFLDNEPDREAILQAINEGVKQADKRGYAVMIGHAWSAELAQVLIDAYPHLVDQGYDFDSLVNYFMGGQGFIESHASAPKNPESAE